MDDVATNHTDQPSTMTTSQPSPVMVAGRVVRRPTAPLMVSGVALAVALLALVLSGLSLLRTDGGQSADLWRATLTMDDMPTGWTIRSVGGARGEACTSLGGPDRFSGSACLTRLGESDAEAYIAFRHDRVGEKKNATVVGFPTFGSETLAIRDTGSDGDDDNYTVIWRRGDVVAELYVSVFNLSSDKQRQNVDLKLVEDLAGKLDSRLADIAK